MIEYQNLIRLIRLVGDRNSTGKVLFGHTLAVDLQDGFPLVSVREVDFTEVVGELTWMLAGDCTNLRGLLTKGIRTWDAHADVRGQLGPVYPVQWRAWHLYHSVYLDQISVLEGKLRRNPPDSTQMFVQSWNPSTHNKVKHRPDDLLFQVFASDDLHLSMQVIRRQTDVLVDLPEVLARYALLLEMFARVSGMTAAFLRINLGVAQLQDKHSGIVQTLLERCPSDLPRISLPLRDSVLDFEDDDVILEGYRPHPRIEFP